MTKGERTKELASDMDYGCTKRDLYPDDAKEIAKALDILGYRKIVWYKVADGDLPEEDIMIWCYTKDKTYHCCLYAAQDFYTRNKYDGSQLNISNDVIAWTYLPEYEE